MSPEFFSRPYLSGESDDIKIGNFIGDYVKGNKYLEYPEQVSFGIRLHRNIDTFTDRHPIVRECINLLRPGYGRYGGIVTDVFFDHFLAANWSDYSICSLRQFAKHAHAVFLSNFGLLPFRVKQVLPFLIQHKRLESYANRESMFQVLEIMSRRTSLPSNSEWAVQLLNQEYDQFQALFRDFFSDLVDFVEIEFDIQISKPAIVLK